MCFMEENRKMLRWQWIWKLWADERLTNLDPEKGPKADYTYPITHSSMEMRQQQGWVLVGGTQGNMSNRQIGPTASPGGESHTRCLSALQCMKHFPPFPQKKKKKKKEHVSVLNDGIFHSFLPLQDAPFCPTTMIYSIWSWRPSSSVNVAGNFSKKKSRLSQLKWKLL